MGRMLKKNKVEESPEVRVETYPWPSFIESDILLPDNPRGSVILERTHTQDDIERNVRVPPEFKRPLATAEKLKPPADLSEEYERTQREMALRRRKKSLDDEEDVNLELSDLMQKSETSTHWGGRRGEKEQPPPAEAPPAQHAQQVPPAAHPPVPGPVQHSAAPAVPSPVAEPVAHEHTITEEIDSPPPAISEEELQQLREQAYQEAFAQGEAEGREAGHAEGQRLGYEDGFRSGEERGEAAGLSRWEERFRQISAIAAEIGEKQAEILQHGEELFLEFTKIAAQSILRAQVQVHDESLRNLFRQVMQPLVEASVITVEAPPEDVSRMQRVLAEETQARITVRENPALKPGDFRVEADKEMVVADLAASVAAIVDDLKRNLSATAEEEKRAG